MLAVLPVRGEAFDVDAEPPFDLDTMRASYTERERSA
jgi:hypothetical protein